MRLRTTNRGSAEREWSFRDALFLGQAPDGGLFVPAALAAMGESERAALGGLGFAERAGAVARHLLGGELSGGVIGGVVGSALDFPVPLREIEPGVFLLELFHGPTHAFKDVGARFMARMMAALREEGDGSDGGRGPATILAATSGDTGGAVASAFHGVPGMRVVVLYPLGRVSPRQEAQFSTLGGNVAAVAVRGAFDDCQRLAREAFADSGLAGGVRLISANSINIGRLIPQTFYYAHAWAELGGGGVDGSVRTDRELVFAVPSGNFGNLAAGLMARRVLDAGRMRFVAATNANSVVPEYLAGRGFNPRASVETISSAMDVGDPSNFRRMLHMFGGGGAFGGGDAGGSGGGRDGGRGGGGRGSGALAAMRDAVSGSAWSDGQTRDCIRDLWLRRGVAVDPHTAVGLLGLRQELRRRPGAVGVALATAHPAKFAETVEPIIGETLPVPPGIAAAMERPRRSIEIEPELGALREVLLEG